MIKKKKKWELLLPYKYAGKLHALIAYAVILTNHDVITSLHSNNQKSEMWRKDDKKKAKAKGKMICVRVTH